MLTLIALECFPLSTEPNGKLTLRNALLYDCIRDAWKACEGMDTDAAMQAYIELVTEVNPEWRSTEMN